MVLKEVELILIHHCFNSHLNFFVLMQSQHFDPASHLLIEVEINQATSALPVHNEKRKVPIRCKRILTYTYSLINFAAARKTPLSNSNKYMPFVIVEFNLRFTILSPGRRLILEFIISLPFMS